MSFNQNTPLVFHWKSEELDKFFKFAPLVGVILFGIIPLILWLLLPSGAFSQIEWAEIGRKLSQKPIQMLQLLLVFITVPVVFWLQYRHLKNARLTLDDSSLSYSSGLPLSRWLDWRLDLDDVRSKKLKLKLSGNKLGSQPIRLYRLSWGVGGIRQMRPAAWVLPNQTVETPQKPITRFGLVNWKSPENAALLQKQFNQLPLIHALMLRGIEIPSVSNTREVNGLDLMANPRMKVAVISFFATLIGAFVLFHLMRHQHYFSAPPLSLQLMFGALAGFLMLIWLWGEKPNEGNTTDQMGFRGTQVLLACLFAVSAGLCAPSLPLLLASTVQSTQEQAFVLQKSQLMLKSMESSKVPDIRPTQALEYWQSLKDGEIVNLPVSRGFVGLWWQYDSSLLQEKVEAFYGSLPRQTKQ